MPWTPDVVFPTRSNGDGQVSTCVEFGLSAPGGTGTVGGLTGQSPTPVSVNGQSYIVGGEGGRGSSGLFASGSAGKAGRVYVRVRRPD